MSDDTEVNPIIQPMTDDEAGNVAVLGAGTPRESEALFALANGWHGTYDKATHEAVERGELERLRAAERWICAASERYPKKPSGGATYSAGFDVGYALALDQTARQFAIDAAQQEGSDHEA